jgi:hypothetical protein
MILDKQRKKAHLFVTLAIFMRIWILFFKKQALCVLNDPDICAIIFCLILTKKRRILYADFKSLKKNMKQEI